MSSERDTITQRELRQYLEVAEQAKQAGSSQDALRKSLIARIQAGATVQPGKLAALLQSSTAQRFSFDALVRILGLKKAEEIKAQLPVTSSETLRVAEIA